MRQKRIWGALLLLALILPAALSGQERRPRGWLGIYFGWERDGAREARVEEVTPGSAAERAGIREGDVVLSISDEPATEGAVDELREGLREGDRVRLRIRRGGEERSFDVTAGARPQEDVIVLRGGERIPGNVEVHERLRIGHDSLRVHMEELMVRMDSLRQHIRVESDGEGRVRVFGIGADSVVVINTDSILRHVWPDSMRHRFRVEAGEGGRVRVFGIGPDSMLVIDADSILRHAWPDSMRTHFEREFRGLRMPVEPWMALEDLEDFDPDVPFFMELGRRAIAGAELAEMNEGLGRYFRTDEGVLVLRVADGTPAGRAGLEAGDVIVRANGEAVESVRDLRRALFSGEGEGPGNLEVLRQGSRRTLEIERLRERVPAPGNRFYYFGPDGERRQREVEVEIRARGEEMRERHEEVRQRHEEMRERHEEVRARAEEARDRARLEAERSRTRGS